MVAVRKVKPGAPSLFRRFLGHLVFTSVILIYFWMIVQFPEEGGSSSSSAAAAGSDGEVVTPGEEEIVQEQNMTCPYTSLNDLTPAELRPAADDGTFRHMVTPPADTKLTLICCQTTKGPWSIVAHDAWAPFGARRFVEMVQDGYFNTHTVPLMRCVRHFLCQFGLAGPASDKYHSLYDDPAWLPAGPAHRRNAAGVQRFAAGYFAYAGHAGGNSRSNQFIVALTPNGPLAGGSPWETPWGELVGKHSFATLAQIHVGYGDNGPKQARLHKTDYVDYVETEFPELDWITRCDIMDEKDDMDLE